ncbi:TRAP transporter small permease subunit [Clostridium sp. MCC353]|uniref:TRAP transporter small permease n=1 Tax=Clostridium sp. MCC353 TaxID=2592646 RepID=UPI001C0172AE|nr:TRAP transporter small permease [Clostridium sp. MCC353]MBT9777933.1 TRAP transporter small permease subunit [Clostridium sp. MCC353]
MKTLRKICDGIDCFFDWTACFCGLLLLLLIGLSLASVVGRMVSRPIFWADEAQRYLMIYMAFTGAGVLSARADHLMVDLLELFVPVKIRRYFYYLSDAVIIGAMFCFLGPSIRMVTKNLAVRSSAMQISMGYVYFCIPLGVVLIIIGTTKVLLAKMFFENEAEKEG